MERGDHKHEKALPKTAGGRPRGAVCAQYKRCGKRSCRCARGELHGPYFSHFVRAGGVLRKRYVRLEDAGPLREACRARREADARERVHARAARRELREALQSVRRCEGVIAELRGGQHE